MIRFLLLLAISVNALAESTTINSMKASEASSSVVTDFKNNATRDINVTSKPYKFSFFSLASARTKDLDKGGTSIGSYNYLGASYKLDKQSQMAFRYVFFHDTAGFKFNPAKRKEENIGHTTTPGDSYFSYSRYDVAEWGGWNLGGQGRIYLPTSQFSRNTGMITQTRLETYLDHGVGKYSSFSYVIKYDYFFQSRTAYIDQEIPLRDNGIIPDFAIKTTKHMNLDHFVEFDWSLHKKFSFKPRLGFEDTWYHGSIEENKEARHETSAKAQLGAEVRPVRSFSVTLALENQTKLINRNDPVAYNSDDNKAMLITYASF